MTQLQTDTASDRNLGSWYFILEGLNITGDTKSTFSKYF